MDHLHSCKNCNNLFSGKFCNACGQKIFNEHDRTIKSLFKEAFHFLTHFEGNFFYTLKSVFTKPGKMSLDYCRGVRKRYFKPVSFFLICIILYLLFPVFEGLNMHFDTYVSPKYNYAWFASPVAMKKAESQNISLQILGEKYDQKSGKFAKPMLLLLLPLSAFFISLLHFRQRKYFYDHFILATELTTFIIVLAYLLMPLVMVTGQLFYKPFGLIFNDGGYAWSFSRLVFIFVCFVAFKRFYTQKWWLALIKGLLFFFIYSTLIVLIYKALLYFTVIMFI